MSGSPTSGKASRGVFLTVMAALFVVLAISNFTKVLQHTNDATKGLVIFGYRLQSAAGNAIFGPIFGLILLIYVAGIWRMKRWVLPLAMVYAFYVPVNMVLFWFAHGADPHPSLRFIIIYLVIALTGSMGTALCLVYRRNELS